MMAYETQEAGRESLPGVLSTKGISTFKYSGKAPCALQFEAGMFMF